jgi:hypothetical protein
MMPGILKVLIGGDCPKLVSVDTNAFHAATSTVVKVDVTCTSARFGLDFDAEGGSPLLVSNNSGWYEAAWANVDVRCSSLPSKIGWHEAVGGQCGCMVFGFGVQPLLECDWIPCLPLVHSASGWQSSWLVFECDWNPCLPFILVHSASGWQSSWLVFECDWNPCLLVGLKPMRVIQHYASRWSNLSDGCNHKSCLNTIGCATNRAAVGTLPPHW